MMSWRTELPGLSPALACWLLGVGPFDTKGDF
jgi:hypothetical protein